MRHADTRRRSHDRTWWCRARAIGCALLLLSACTADPGYDGRSSDQWIAQLTGQDGDQRVDAAHALGKVLALQPNAPRVIKALIVALADTSDDVRVAAAEALRNAARGSARVQARLARDAVPGIVALLDDSQHVEVRRDAARILGSFGVAADSQTLVPLGRALQDPSPDVRRVAARALAEMSRRTIDVVPRLVDASRDSDIEVRRVVLGALAASEAPAQVAGPTLVRGLRDSAAVVREAVALGLGQRTPAGLRALATADESAAGAISALRVATRDAAPAVRLAAVTSLGLLADATSRLDLQRALADPDSAVRREAAHALTALHRRGGRDPSPPEPLLLELCRSNPQWPGC